jgi:fibro-slime domain-containing protein
MTRRSLKLMVVGVGMVALTLSLAASPALALSLEGNYFILGSAHQDTLGNIDNATVTGLVLPALSGTPGTATSGPLVNPGAPVPASGAITDTVAGKIQWWTAHGTGNTGVSVDPSIPGGVRTDNFVGPVLGGPGFAVNFFANGALNNANGYRAVHWTGAFSVGGLGATLSMTADDDAWLFLNGALELDNGGVKALGLGTISNTSLVAGDYIVDLFFADRHQIQSGIAFTCIGCLDQAVDLEPIPEPATLLLFGTTLAGLGAVIRRRIKGQKASEV